jgi:hypothetical protein
MGISSGYKGHITKQGFDIRLRWRYRRVYIYRSYIIYMRIWLVARVELSIQKGARPAPRSYERLRAGNRKEIVRVRDDFSKLKNTSLGQLGPNLGLTWAQLGPFGSNLGQPGAFRRKWA